MTAEAEGDRNRRSWWGAALCALVVVFGGCGSSSSGVAAHASRAGAAPSTTNSLGAEADEPIDAAARQVFDSSYDPGTSGAQVVALPSDGYGTIQTLAAPADGSGVWAWTSSNDDSRIWHADGHGASESWSIGDGPSLLGGVAKPALAACGSRAWFGIDRTLVEVDAGRGVVGTVTVPQSRPIAAVDAHRPASLRGRSGITALACTGSTVVVGLSDATQGFAFDIATRQFASIDLPASYEATSVACTVDGEIAFGMRGYGDAPVPPQVLVTNREQTSRRLVAVDDVSALVARGSDLFAGIGEQRVDSGGARGAERVVPVKVSERIDPLAGRVPVEIGAALVYLDARTHRVMRTDAQATAAPVAIDLGTAPCGPIYDHRSRSTVPGSPSGRCPVGVRELIADGDGHLFVVPGDGSTVPVLQVSLSSD